MRMNNDWKGYEVKPDEGLFDTVRRRLRIRRALRIGGVTLVAVTAAVVVLLSLNREEIPDVAEAEHQASVAVVSQPLADEAASAAVDMDVQAKPTMAADAERLSDNSQILPQAQAELPKIDEPVNDDLFDESLFSKLAETHENSIRTAERRVAEPEGENVEQTPASGDEAATPAKVGAADPVPYKVDNIIWAPNIITPNGDVQENRVFKVVASSDVNDFRIHIYNRGGRLLFKSSDINEEWDASHNGTPVPQGAYVWVATFRGADGSSHREAGTVTVVW